MKRLRVLLVEDHGLVRAGFRALLDGISGVQVVGEAADGRSGLSMIGLKKPHVVLMDIALPKLNGLGGTRTRCERSAEGASRDALDACQ